MNTIIFTGNTTRDAELRYTGDQKAVLNFTVANNQGYGDKERTEYYDCSLWGPRAEKLVDHITKGTKLTVNGEHSTVRNEKDGKTYFSNRIFVRDFEFGGSPQGGAQGGAQSQPTANNQQGSAREYANQSGGTARPTQTPQADFDDDLPY